MSNTKRFAVAGASVAAALLPAAGLATGAIGSEPAISSPSDVRLKLVIDDTAQRQANGEPLVTGTVNCPAGKSFLLTVNLRQGAVFTGDFIGGTCTGADQPWSVQQFGGTFRLGSATAGAILQWSDGSLNEVETYNGVKVVR